MGVFFEILGAFTLLAMALTGAACWIYVGFVGLDILEKLYKQSKRR